MRLIRLLLAFLSVAFGVALVALNGDVVRLDLLWVELDLPLGLLLLCVLFTGALLGGIAALLSRTPVAHPASVSDEGGTDA